jgi:hypothetical protein
MSLADTDEQALPAGVGPKDEVGEAPTFASGNADPIPVNYFGGDVTERVTFPDGVQWVEVKEFTEGDRRKYLMAINKDIRVERQSGSAFLKNTAAVDRYELLQVAVIDWKLFRPDPRTSDMIEVKFSAHELRIFLDKGPPKIFELIEKQVRKLNPWLMADLTVEQLEEQIAELQEMVEVKLKEEAGKES